MHIWYKVVFFQYCFFKFINLFVIIKNFDTVLIRDEFIFFQNNIIFVIFFKQQNGSLTRRFRRNKRVK